MNNINGFTLIEVIIVIVILAIVPVVAAPKYLNLLLIFPQKKVLRTLQISLKRYLQTNTN
ncbi:prepilin-type N-terminal cleavage/methylation domain-containing protein [Colwelliaceae bacterium BS250]